MNPIMEDSRIEAIQPRQKRRANDADHAGPPPKRKASDESRAEPGVVRNANPNSTHKGNSQNELNPRAQVSRKEQKRRNRGGKKAEKLAKKDNHQPNPRDALADVLPDGKLKKLAIRHLRKHPNFSLKDALLRTRTTCGKKVIHKVEGALKNLGMDHGPEWDESERVLLQKREKKLRKANEKKFASKSDTKRATERARVRLEADLKRARDRARARPDSPSDGEASVGDTPGSSPEDHMTTSSEMDESSDSASVGEKPPVEDIQGDHVAPCYPSTLQPQVANGLQYPPDASELAPPPPPPTPPLPPPPPDGLASDLRLYQCPPDEQELQMRYFGTTDPGALVTCLRCAQPGHISQSCPNRTCHHCGVRDLHLPIHCPRSRKCARCRQRGHPSRHCTNPTRIPSTLADACEICQVIGHVEEQCPYLGRMVRPDRGVTQKIPREQMIVACYRCGSNRHWGDDCNLEKVNASRAQGILREWSREYAAFFLQADDQAQTGMQVGNGDVEGSRGASVPQYQLAQLGDWT